MGKLHSKHAAACKPRENPEGDSFAVNASLARKGLEEWPVNSKGSGGDGDGGLGVPQGCPHRALGKYSGPRKVAEGDRMLPGRCNHHKYESFSTRLEFCSCD